MSQRRSGRTWTRRTFVARVALSGAGVAAGCILGKAGVVGESHEHSERLPTLYIPHGGGPCFFMDWTMGPADTWDHMAAWLRSLGARFGGARALLVISAHWEAPVVTVQTGNRPPLFFDYYGFPDHTYELTWPAPGAPAVASRVRECLANAGIASRTDAQRGFDHGTFVPLKVALPEAQIPTLQLSLDSTLDAAAHVALGRALAPLRDEGVLIVGSGLSFHNMRAMGSPGAATARSRTFDAWLATVCSGDPEQRQARLTSWTEAPEARYCHPREEHLLPLMVAAGAAGTDPGRRIFRDQVMGVAVSAFEFGRRA